MVRGILTNQDVDNNNLTMDNTGISNDSNDDDCAAVLVVSSITALRSALCHNLTALGIASSSVKSIKEICPVGQYCHPKINILLVHSDDKSEDNHIDVEYLKSIRFNGYILQLINQYVEMVPL